jgi:recombination protein RecR
LDISQFAPSLDRLVNEIAKLPGLGKKSAARLALFILRQSNEDATNFAQAILDVKARIHLCKLCSNFTENDLCAICADPKRDHGLICVVETPGDVLRLEKLSAYRGLYHVLGGALSPLDGVSPDMLRVKELFDRIADGKTKEVILATNANTDGDATALYLARELKARNIPVSRIARGVPIGSEIEQVDEVTLASALAARVTL